VQCVNSEMLIPFIPIPLTRKIHFQEILQRDKHKTYFKYPYQIKLYRLISGNQDFSYFLDHNLKFGTYGDRTYNPNHRMKTKLKKYK